MSSEGATRSHPRGGLYVFVPCSQFPKGGGGCDGDERVQRHKRDRVLEPPCVDAGRGPPLPVRVERNLERLRQIRVFHDQATSRFSVAEPSAQFMLDTRTARASTTAPLLWRRSMGPRGLSRRTSSGRLSFVARRLIRSRTSSFVPESASTEAQLPSRRIRTETPRRAAANAASRNGFGVSRHISSR